MSAPSLYSAEMLEKAKAYVHDFETYDHAFPSIIGLSEVLGVCRKTVYNWEAAHEDFAEVMEQIDTRQQMVAWNKGLRGEYNANLVKLLLGKHGYSEKAEQTIQGGENPISQKWTVEFINASSEG